jgi:hypothetical protein
MLKNNAPPLDLPGLRDELLIKCADQLETIREQAAGQSVRYLANEKVLDIAYPVQQYPQKVSSCNLDIQPEITGVLQGIKGQYLIFDCGVINIRKYAGYELEVSY